MYDGDHRPEARARVRATRAVEIWAILNVTPDSFSDGGRYLALDAALARAKVMLAEGADVVDVGGASSRPRGATYGDGAAAVPVDVELGRVVPVVEILARELGARVSVDTRSGTVAEAALAAGACIVNDVSMGADETLLQAVAAKNAALVLMHTRGSGEVSGATTHYADVARDVSRELATAIARARALGVREVWADPGLGFAKTATQSAELLARLPVLAELGVPLLVGASRKAFLGALAARRGEVPAPAERLPASLVAAVAATQGGAAAVRVHDVRETRQALDVWLGLEALDHA